MCVHGFLGSQAAEEWVRCPWGLGPTQIVILAPGPGVDSILGHLLGAAVQGLPAVSGRHKATSVPRNPGQASSGNKCHIWWER